MKKQKCRRLLSCVLALVMLLSIIPVMTASAYSDGMTEDGFMYRIEYGKAKIIGYEGNPAKVIIPSEVEGYPVTSIDYLGIEIDYYLESVTIPYGVETIGVLLFENCRNLKSVELPDSITTIGDYAFSGCEKLEDIELPSSLTGIGTEAFKSCSSIKHLNFPEGLTYIGDSAFENCTGLDSVELPDSIGEVGSNVFYNCQGIKNVTLSYEIMRALNDTAFSQCDNIVDVYFEGTLEEWVSSCYDNYGFIKSGFQNATIRFVDEREGNTGITPEGFIYDVDDRAVVINGYMPGNRQVTVPAEIDDYPVKSINSIAEVTYTGSSYGSSVWSVVIPHGVETIGLGAFANCYNLTSVEIPDSVTSIGTSAFTYCQNLTNIAIPDSVTKIGADTFSWCNNLNSITMSDSVKEIGFGAFAECYNLSDVYYYGTEDDWNSISIDEYGKELLMSATIHFIKKHPTVTGNSITLFGDIGVNFFMEVPEKVLEDEDATVIFTYDGNTVTVPVSDGELTDHGYKYTCNIPAKNMFTEVNCVVDIPGLGQSEAFKYTVKEYAESILAKPQVYSEEAVALVKSMLNYGTAAQEYFGYNTDALANDTEYMTDEDRVVPTKEFSNLEYTLTEGAGDVKYYGTALNLKSEVGIKHYFTLTEGVNADELVVMIDDEAVKLIKNGNLYMVEVPDIAAHNLYKKYDVQVGDVNISYCVMDYAATAQSINNQAILKVMYALDAYAQNAIAYQN